MLTLETARPLIVKDKTSFDWEHGDRSGTIYKVVTIDDDGYRLELQSHFDVWNGLQIGSYYEFDYSLSIYRGKIRLKIIDAVPAHHTVNA